ncbi:ogr/Delta-like zinc finger family protein [Klebsiella pneumoniae]
MRQILTRRFRLYAYQCTNINCSCTFVTMESVERFIVTPGVIIPAPPHPSTGGQRTLWL